MPLLLRDDGVPVASVNRYAVVHLRVSGLSPNTVLNHVRDLKVAQSFFDAFQIDIVERAERFQFLSQHELLNLAEWLRRRNIAHSDINVNSSNAIVSETAGNRIVSNEVHAARIRHARDFVVWLAHQALHRVNDSTDYLAARKRVDDFKRAVNRHVPRSDSAADGERLGLTPKQRERLLEIVRPDSSENPFQQQHRHRNHAIAQLLFSLGLRASELLGLKIEDVDLQGRFSSDGSPSITVRRRPDDPDDTRTRPALQKTGSRILDLSAGTPPYRALEVWLTRHRIDERRYPGAKRCPYVFVSRIMDRNDKGRPVARPLAQRTLNHIFERIARVDPQSVGGLHPHILRHTWNDRFVEHVDENEDWAEAAKLQRFQQGWSDTSTMPSRYGRRATRKQAGRKQERMNANLEAQAGRRDDEEAE
jgi:integrase